MRLFILILSVDVVFITVDFVNELVGTPLGNVLDITRDGTPPELFQYAKFAAIVAILLSMARRRRSICYVVLGGFFTYLLFDDMIHIHERLGALIASEAGIAPAFGLRAVDFGELAVSACALAAMLPALIWAYRSGSTFFRIVWRNLAVLFALLVVFGVGVDMARSMVMGVDLIDGGLGLVEDGGEMIVTTLILGYLTLVDEVDPERRSLLTARAGRSIPPRLRPVWITV